MLKFPDHHQHNRDYRLRCRYPEKTTCPIIFSPANIPGQDEVRADGREHARLLLHPASCLPPPGPTLRYSAHGDTGPEGRVHTLRPETTVSGVLRGLPQP